MTWISIWSCDPYGGGGASQLSLCSHWSIWFIFLLIFCICSSVFLVMYLGGVLVTFGDWGSLAGASMYSPPSLCTFSPSPSHQLI